MGYKDYFDEEELLKIENQLLEILEAKRDDFTEPLWEDFNFIYKSLPYLNYKSNFGYTLELVSEKFYSNMLVVCALIENLRSAHNFIGVECVLERVPKEAWYEKTFAFLHNVECADITALDYCPKELIDKDVIMNAIYQVPRQEDFYEEFYIKKFLYVVDKVPVNLWKDEKFVKELKEEFTSTYNYINRLDDLKVILEAIEAKLR